MNNLLLFLQAPVSQSIERRDAQMTNVPQNRTEVNEEEQQLEEEEKKKKPETQNFSHWENDTFERIQARLDASMKVKKNP